MRHMRPDGCTSARLASLFCTYKLTACCRFKDGEKKLMDSARHLKDDVKEGVHRFGEKAEQDADR